MNPWILLAVLVLIALAAPRYGVDSRWLPPGEMPPPRRGPTPRSDVVDLARWVRARIARTGGAQHGPRQPRTVSMTGAIADG